jgi:dihydroorotase
MKLRIRGGRLLDPSRSTDRIADLWIEDGVIRAHLSLKDPSPSKPDREFDARGAVVSPGFTDLHAHLREPGQTEKEDIESGAKAAVAGGFTAVLCMPNTFPVNDHPDVTRFILEKAARVARCRVYPVGAVSKGLEGEQLTPMEELKDAGCVAFSDDGRPVHNPRLLRQALSKMTSLDSLLMEHCEEPELSASATIHAGAVAASLGLEGIPRSAETVDAMRTLTLSAETKARVHLSHVSCAATLDLIRAFRESGRVTSEVTPHHLALTVEAVRDYGTNAKMYPPLRTIEDRGALQAALAEGLIDAVATDHAPHTAAEKSRPFAQAPNGVIGLETCLPVLLSLVWDGALSLNRAVEALTAKPAGIARVSGGTLAVGAPADVVVFDTDEARALGAADLASKSANSPFLGFHGRGRVLATFVSGRQVFPEVAA